MKPPIFARQQQGAASLLIALVLMMVTTLITLSVARTHVSETHMAGNDHWHSRLQLIAQSEWGKASAELTRQPSALLLGTRTKSAIEGVETSITYHQPEKSSRLVTIQTVTGRPDGTGLTGRVSQKLLLLTVLSPQGEAAPPLVMNGCLSGGAPHFDVRPINSNRDNAGDAVWQVAGARCIGLDAIDLHGGRNIDITLNSSLWSLLFSVSPDDFKQLAAKDLRLPITKRRYWLASPADLTAGKWTRSLGEAATPVALVFPPTTGCPHFADGVQIFGFVFIDGDCPQPLTDGALEITGTLTINGSAAVGNGSIRLDHIQVADSEQDRLSFPILRAVTIPGTWRDF